MRDRKVIVVVGASGAQGGGLVRAILNSPFGEFSPRVLTREDNSVSAKLFARLGAEIVQADLDDPDSVRRAFRGAYGAFCVTFFWVHRSTEREIAEAKTMVEAAKDCGLQHVIWSTLEDTRNWIPLSDTRMPTLEGRYKVPHFDGKGESDQFFRDMDVPATFLRTSFYWENFINFGMGPKSTSDDRWAITFPMGDKKLPGIAAEDIGKCAYAIFRDCDKYVGKTIGIAGERLSGSQMAAIFTKVLGKPVTYNSVSPDAYRGLGFDGARELGNMFQFKRDFERDYCENRNPAFARILNPLLLDFETWLRRNAGAIPLTP